jgi:hypothetical protein
VIYIKWREWVIAAFIAVILFPLIRISASAAHSRWKEARRGRLQFRDVQKRFERFSAEERLVLKVFVEAGGAVVTWRQMNKANVSMSAVESLKLREVLESSVTLDGMAETFVIEPEIFDLAQRFFFQSSPSQAPLSLSDSDDVPF